MVLEIGRFDMNKLQGRLPVAWSRYICASLTLALEHVHSSGHVHADIKLENVLLSCDGTPMLADFGEAVPLPTLDATVQLDGLLTAASGGGPTPLFRVAQLAKHGGPAPEPPRARARGGPERGERAAAPGRPRTGSEAAS